MIIGPILYLYLYFAYALYCTIFYKANFISYVDYVGDYRHACIFCVMLFEDLLRNWHCIVVVEGVYISVNVVKSVMLL